MRAVFSSSLIVVLLAIGAPAPGFEASDYGAGISLETETTLATIVGDPDEWTGKNVLVRGRVTDVCQRKGCWTVIRAGEEHVRVRFKDYGFFLPTDCRGREALVEGIVSVKTLSERMARHYEEESIGGDPDGVDGPRREIGITAAGVRLLP